MTNDGSPIATELDPNSQAAKIRADDKLRTAANSALGKSHRMLGPGDGPLGTGFRPDGTLTKTHGPMANGAQRVTGSILGQDRASGLAGIGVALPRGYSVLSSGTIRAGDGASINGYGVPVFTIRGPSGVLVTEKGFAPVCLPGGLR